MDLMGFHQLVNDNNQQIVSKLIWILNLDNFALKMLNLFGEFCIMKYKMI